MPLSGMTGFGRAEAAAGDWSWSVEARSVNGRNLEIRYRGVPGFETLDRVARDAGQSRFQRGNITIGITGKRSDAAGKVSINHDQIERYLAAGAQLIADGRATPPSLDGLLGLRGVIEASEAGEDAEALAAVEAAMALSLNAALDALLANRREEGAALAVVLTGQIDRIAALVAQAETEAAGQTAAIKDRFERRMKDLAPDTPGLADRIVVEAAALAVKADVREELDRLLGHVDAARALMAGEGPAGRRLDFLTQEFMREANTLCAKSALPGLTTVGLDLKAVIEQFREQVQNVE